jgi:hypothetical protein
MRSRPFAVALVALAVSVAGALAQTPFPYTALNSPSSIPCYGDGQSGKRIQVVTVYGAHQHPWTSEQKRDIKHSLQRADWYLNKNAQESSGNARTRHYRFVTNSNCIPILSEVMVPQSVWKQGGSAIQANIRARAPQEFARSDRVYAMYVKGSADAKSYDCGWGEWTGDDRDTASNANNDGDRYACIFDFNNSTAILLHEIGHVLGAVNNSAPHSTGEGHADDGDVIGGNTLWFDKGYDDYFDALVEPGEYLDTHWNLADSAFLGS